MLQNLKLLTIQKKIVIQADASKNGLGACMLQEGKPVYFISRSLSEAEQSYSQIEKELLAIVFACQKLHYFIYGREIQVVTDHKPLVGLFKKELNKIPNARLQRMLLRLMKYQITLSHSPGKYMYIADLLSRHSDPNEKGEEIPDINHVIHSINVGDNKKKEFVKETGNDVILSELKRVLTEGWPEDKSKLREDVRFLWKMRNDLTLDDGIIFLNDRIFVPQSMRIGILDQLHRSHLGVEKTKARARSLVYWPGLNEAIENKIASCEICQRYRSSNIREPYLAHDIPLIPFSKICMDFCEVGKKSYLIVTDYFSKYLEILPVKNKSTQEVVSKLKMLFSTHGIPKTIIADNVPFGSYEFRKFGRQYDIDIITTSPNYPQANGLAEKSVQTAKLLIKKATDSNQELWLLLLEYRNTPVKGSNLSPAEILMGRKQRTCLPAKENLFKTQNMMQLHQFHTKNRLRNERYYNQRVRKRCGFEEGDFIWIKTKHCWDKGRIKAKHTTPRSYWVEKADGSILRRNSRFIRPRNQGN